MLLVAVAGEAVLGQEGFDDRVEPLRGVVRHERRFLRSRPCAQAGSCDLFLSGSNHRQRKNEKRREMGAPHPIGAQTVDGSRWSHLCRLFEARARKIKWKPARLSRPTATQVQRAHQFIYTRRKWPPRTAGRAGQNSGDRCLSLVSDFSARRLFHVHAGRLLTDIVNNGLYPPLRLMESALLSGGLGVVYFVVANRPKWFPLLIAGHILVVSQFDRLTPAPTPPLVGEALQARLRTDTSIVSASLIVSFILLSHFVRREGLRYVRAHTEISLARDIHRLLVPPVARRIGSFEFCGISIPSGDVGGDLIDLVESNGHWIGYVADVSGHGVGAGLLMGMAKSSARTQLRVAEPINQLLNTLNAVLFDLRSRNVHDLRRSAVRRHVGASVLRRRTSADPALSGGNVGDR